MRNLFLSLNKVKLHSKRMNHTHDSFVTKAKSIKADQRMSQMLEDYRYNPHTALFNQRNSVNSKRMIYIYENDENLRTASSQLKTSIRK